MIIQRIILKNWMNFPDADIKTGQRAFFVGPNASGKSNFLDAFRFLHDIAREGGGLNPAIESRGGISKIRSLSARRHPEVIIGIELGELGKKEHTWKYEIGIGQEQRGNHKPYIISEKVWKGDRLILNRPTEQDKSDKFLLYETHLETMVNNQPFREIRDYFNTIQYIHLIPQFLRYPQMFLDAKRMPEDPFGKNFLEKVAKTPKKTRESRLKKIETVLQKAVPQLTELTFIQDELGIPHLEAKYEHWRPNAGKQRETQFSDGTLRMIVLLWSLIEVQGSLLLLEEPELSLHSGIITQLPSLMYGISRNKKNKGQIFISTHSADLLSDGGIGGEEVFIITPGTEGSRIIQSSSVDEIKILLDSGFNAGQSVIPYTIPPDVGQMTLSDGF